MSPLALLAIAVGAGVLIGTGIAVLMWPSSRRARAIRALSTQRGLSYMGKTWVLGDCDFALFQKGQERRWNNVMSGPWNGTTLVYTDYEFTEDGEGSRQTYRFSAVVTDLGCRMPQVDVTERSMVGGLAEELGVHALDFDSEQLNERFVVESEDEAFAHELIDSRMQEVLLQCPPDVHVQFGPHRMVVWGQRRAQGALASILDAAAALDQRVPVVVRQDHAVPSATAASPSL